MKRFIILVVIVFAQAAQLRADIPLNEADQILVAITNLHLTRVSLTYRFTTAQQMLDEANFFSERLGLPTPRPIQVSDVKNVYVSPPVYAMDEELGQLMKENSSANAVIAKLRTAKIVAGGFIETTNFVFSFNKGYLWGVNNRVKHIERFDLYDEWAKTPSLIDTNGAYQLATQWLSAVDVDVGALEKKYAPKVEQQWCWTLPGLNVYHSPGDTNKTMLPIYDVTWGTNWTQFPARVQILGTTKELMVLNFSDFSVSRRPQLVVTNAVELNNIPDPQLKDLKRPQISQTNSSSP